MYVCRVFRTYKIEKELVTLAEFQDNQVAIEKG
jgi:hypothetical protein